VDEVVVFGRTAGKLAKINGQFGFATTTDLDAVITDPSVDLVDICLPTALHAEVAVRAMQSGKDVLNLIEPVSALPALELTLDVHQRLTHAAG
jgi:UDP-N-acetylglucosamine 3-dehydrogenase